MYGKRRPIATYIMVLIRRIWGSVFKFTGPFKIDAREPDQGYLNTTKNVENGVDALVFFNVRCGLLAFSRSCNRKINISLKFEI